MQFHADITRTHASSIYGLIKNPQKWPTPSCCDSSTGAIAPAPRGSVFESRSGLTSVNNAKCFLINSFSRHGPYCYCDTFSAAITYCCNTIPTPTSMEYWYQNEHLFFQSTFLLQKPRCTWEQKESSACITRATIANWTSQFLEVFDSLSCLNKIIFCCFYFLFHWIETESFVEHDNGKAWTHGQKGSNYSSILQEKLYLYNYLHIEIF